MGMDISPNALRKETVQVLNQVNSQIHELKETSAATGIAIEKLRDTNGSWVMIPLLLAKAQCLSTLTQLNEQSKR